MTGAHRGIREQRRQLHLPQLPPRTARALLIAESLLLIAAALAVAWLLRNPPDPRPAPQPQPRTRVFSPPVQVQEGPCTPWFGWCKR